MPSVSVLDSPAEPYLLSFYLSGAPSEEANGFRPDTPLVGGHWEFSGCRWSLFRRSVPRATLSPVFSERSIACKTSERKNAILLVGTGALGYKRGDKGMNGI